MMNTFIISVGCLFAIANGNPYLQAPFKIQKAFLDCKNELHLTVPKAEKKLSMSGPLTLPIFDQKYACLNKCTMEKSEILTPEGELNYKIIPKEITSLVKECDEMSKTLKACDRAHNLTICTIEKIRSELNRSMMKCSQETITQVDQYKAYKLKDFLNEKKYYCLNKCMFSCLYEIDIESGTKLNMVTAFAPPVVNNVAIVEKCTKENTYKDQCKMVAKRELCILKKVQTLAEIILGDY